MIADALSLARLVAAFPLAWAMWETGREAAILAAVLITFAILSDLADGRVARRLGTESARGRLLDHGADFLTVSGALFAASLRGALPLVLPILICVAFLQYVVDSRVVRREQQLRMSSLGKWNGILYFFPVCGDILSRLGLGFLAEPVRWLAWILVATTALSLVDRLHSLRSHFRTVRDSPGAGTPGRSRR